MDIIKKFVELTEKTFNNPGWMDDFYNDIVKKRQFIVKVDKNNDISAFVAYWRFGDKRWGFIRKINKSDKCPKQMGKGKHLYIPIFYVRPDRMGEINMKDFIPSITKTLPDIDTISWHFGDKFITKKIKEESRNGD